jgi:hypothetical protein
MHRIHLASVPALLLAFGACLTPSDQSDQVRIVIEAPSELLVQGKTMMLSAHARRVNGGAGGEVSGIVIAWSTENPEVATVEGRPDGTALVTPVTPGIALIRAVAPALENAEPGALNLRVTSAVTIDSVRPTLVHYGDQVTVYGVGLGTITRASLGPGDLLPDSSSFVGQPEGLGRINLWVPFPAATSPLVVTSRLGTVAASSETTYVRPQDRYHELGLPAPTIELGGAPVRGQDTLYFDPALALVDGEGFDLLHFHHPTPGSLTFTLFSTGPVLTLFNPVLTVNPVPASTFEGGFDFQWAIGFRDQSCQGFHFPLGRPVGINAPVRLVRALKDLDVTDLYLAVYGEPSGQYGVTVQSGYVTADPRIGPDRFEENDFCDAADVNAADPSRRLDLPFSDTLTIDNPYDVDWFRLHVPGIPFDPNQLITIRTAARPFAATDSSDIGLILEPIDSSRSPGSSERLTVSLGPDNDFLIAVVDEAGVPTRYSLCVAVGSTCSFLDERAASSRSGPLPGGR